MSKLGEFPCKQMPTTEEYRDKHKEVFGETDIFKNLAKKRYGVGPIKAGVFNPATGEIIEDDR